MMGPLRPLGVLLGLAACVAVGVSIHFLIMTGSCGGDAPACPTDIGPYMLLLPAGIVGAVIAIFLGGGAVVFSGLFVAVGLGALSTLLPLHGGKSGSEDPWFAILFGGIFTLSGLGTGLLPLGLGLLGKRKADDAAWLIANGRQGIGRIASVQDTGVTVNDNPRVRLTMQVQPTDGSPPVTLEKTLVVSRVAVPRVGESFPVWFDPARPSRWAFGTDLQASAPAAVQALFALASGPMSASARAGIPGIPGTSDVPGSAKDPFDEITRLAALRDSGAITAQDYETTKARLLRRIGAD